MNEHITPPHSAARIAGAAAAGTAASEGDLLRVDDLAVSFMTPGGPVSALRGITFRVRAGSNVAIVGESGSGKSVTAQAIMGLLPRNATIEAGTITFNDPATAAAAAAADAGKSGRTLQAGKPAPTSIDLAALDPRSTAFRSIRGGRISMIFQEPMTSLSPVHRIGDQIREALELHASVRGQAAETRVRDMLKLVRFPDPERGYKSFPFELSGGLRQRVMIAMALVCRPSLLIADEPTTALDVTVQAQVLGLIRDLQSELGMAVMLITHDMGVVANVADEVVVLYRGQRMEAGTAQDIFTTPRHPYLVALMNAVPRIDIEVPQRLQPMGMDADQAEEAARARARAAAGDSKALAARSDASTPLLSVRNLHKSFQIRAETFGFDSKTAKTVKAVDNISLDVRAGECLGLVGESGCGKTTLSKMIMGAVRPDEGEIIYAGDEGEPPVDLAQLDEAGMRPLRRHIQYLFQDPNGSLNPRMTVLSLVAEPMRVQKVGTEESRRQRVEELLDIVRLDPRFLNRYPHSFSGGQRQRLGIARALTLSPRMLILDEPVSALDVSTQAQVLNLLNDLRADMGLTYLFITHNLAVVNYVADRIAVMCAGRLVELAPRRNIFADARHPYTRALLASAPSPDLKRPLDFEAIRDGAATRPENWPAPFDDHADDRARMVEVADGHFVRQRGA
ncbi:MAG: ABC transporter ATP-binding protein [Pseudomonadota bacterium]